MSNEVKAGTESVVIAMRKTMSAEAVEAENILFRANKAAIAAEGKTRDHVYSAARTCGNRPTWAGCYEMFKAHVQEAGLEVSRTVGAYASTISANWQKAGEIGRDVAHEAAELTEVYNRPDYTGGDSLSDTMLQCIARAADPAEFLNPCSSHYETAAKYWAELGTIREIGAAIVKARAWVKKHGSKTVTAQAGQTSEAAKAGAPVVGGAVPLSGDGSDQSAIKSVPVRESLGKLIRAVHDADGIVDEKDLVAYLANAAKDLTEMAAKARQSGKKRDEQTARARAKTALAETLGRPLIEEGEKAAVAKTAH